MFLSTRTFIRQHTLTLYITLALLLGLSVVNVWALFALISSSSDKKMSFEELLPILQAFGILGVFVLYILAEYAIWVVRYYYFFKLYKLVEAKMAVSSLIHLKSANTLLEITKEEGLFRIAVIDPVSTKTKLLAVVGDDYFNESESLPNAKAGVAMRYLGPLRNLSDAKSFKRWYKMVRRGKPRRISFREPE